MRVRVVAFGVPQPKGSHRMVGRSKKGSPILVNDAKGYKAWHNNVMVCGIEQMLRARLYKPLDGPLLGRFVFTMPRPESAAARLRPDTPPDLDKLLRAVCDALKQGRVIHDDSRIVELSRLAKVYPQQDPEALVGPGVIATIEPLPESNATV